MGNRCRNCNILVFTLNKSDRNVSKLRPKTIWDAQIDSQRDAVKKSTRTRGLKSIKNKYKHDSWLTDKYRNNIGLSEKTTYDIPRWLLLRFVLLFTLQQVIHDTQRCVVYVHLKTIRLQYYNNMKYYNVSQKMRLAYSWICCIQWLSIWRPSAILNYRRPRIIIIIIINNNNNHDNVYGAVIMAEPLQEFTRFIWWM